MSSRKAIGQRLRDRREEVGLTQAVVAERIGVSQETVSRWESGSAAIGLGELGALARLYRAPVGWFAAAEGDAPPPYAPEEPTEPVLPKMGHKPAATSGAKKRGRRA